MEVKEWSREPSHVPARSEPDLSSLGSKRQRWRRSKREEEGEKKKDRQTSTIELQPTCDAEDIKSEFKVLFNMYHQMMCEKIGELMIKVHVLESQKQPYVKLSVEGREEDWEEKVGDKVLLKRLARKVEYLEEMFEKTETLDELFEKLKFMTQDFKSAQHWFSKNLQKTTTAVIDELSNRYDMFCERYTLIKMLGECSDFRDLISDIIFTVLPNIGRILPPASEGEEWAAIKDEKIEEKDEEEWDGYVEEEEDDAVEENEEDDGSKQAAAKLMIKHMRENDIMLTKEQCDELLEDDDDDDDEDDDHSEDSGYASAVDVVDGKWWMFGKGNKKKNKEAMREAVKKAVREAENPQQKQPQNLTVPVSRITKHLGKTYLGAEIEEVFTKVLLIKNPGGTTAPPAVSV